ncbi:MAG: hypothetical protein IPK32_05875 [Verrucomicrobiaceae bacterium]|nr:hypothetical protein [Verrucomicrobiaceae bacterium]
MTRLELAKQRLTIPDLAALRGWQWEPGRSCRVPYRADKSPSGSVYADGLLMFDHATGETLDAPAILAKVEGLSPQDACRLFIELARIRPEECDDDRHRARMPAQRPPETLPPLSAKPELPALHAPRDGHLRAIARIRGLDLAALEMAVSRGLLWVCQWHGLACWAVTDVARWLCQVRRLDGKPFTRQDGSTFKAWTLPKCCARWPLGIGEAVELSAGGSGYPEPPQLIAICEGGPDMLAVLHLAHALGCADRVAPVAMLGASTRIVADALPLFAGKRVRIFPHADAAHEDGKAPGLEAAARWQDQLTAAGADVDVFDLAGIPGADGVLCKDLNDLARVPVASLDDDVAALFEP